MFSSRQALVARPRPGVHAQRLADHRADEPVELGLVVVDAVLVVRQRHAERARGALLGADRHAHVRHLAPARAAEDARAVEEQRLLAHLRHHHRPAALGHAPDDSLADPVAGVAHRRRSPARGLDREVGGRLVAQHDQARERAAALLEDREHPLQRLAQVEGRAQRLADLQQVGELARVGRPRRHGGIITEM